MFQNSNGLYTDRVFAGLAMVIVLVLLVEGGQATERLALRR
ncbi:ABC transporter permease [Xanthomonas fragariae]|nr:ABC transporter permease [Xanthomonas fragariae]